MGLCCEIPMFQADSDINLLSLLRSFAFVRELWIPNKRLFLVPKLQFGNKEQWSKTA